MKNLFLLLVLQVSLGYSQGFVECAVRSDKSIVSMMPSTESVDPSSLTTPPSNSTWHEVTISSLQPLGTPQGKADNPDLLAWLHHACNPDDVPLYIFDNGKVSDRSIEEVENERKDIQSAKDAEALSNTPEAIAARQARMNTLATLNLLKTALASQPALASALQSAITSITNSSH